MTPEHLKTLLAPIRSFLKVETPDAWIEHAIHQLDVLLIDHANCELKAAQTAVALLKRYALTTEQSKDLLAVLKPYEDFVYRKEDMPERGYKNDLFAKPQAVQTSFEQELIQKMLRLIKEELHHFEQVVDIMAERHLQYSHVPAGRYAKQLIRHVRHYEPEALVDKLIIGALIEARSCERFAKLAPHLEGSLQSFYVSLLRSEARHYQDYLALAQKISPTRIDERVAFFVEQEASLIALPDPHFCFHSGAPA